MDLELCAQLVYSATFHQPAEYCANEREPGSDYCEDHVQWEPDWDDLRKDRLVVHD